MAPGFPSYSPRADALLAALPPALVGTLLPGALGALMWLDRFLGYDPAIALVRLGRWQASSELTAILGLLAVSASTIGFVAAIAAAIVLRFPLWHYPWSGSGLVVALSLSSLLSPGTVTPLVLLAASPALALLGAGWAYAWRRHPTEAGIFALAAGQVITLLMLLAASSPPLLRPDLVPWAAPAGALDAAILFAAVCNPPQRRLWPLAAGALLNAGLLPSLDGTRLGGLWIGPRGLTLLAVLGTAFTLTGPLWQGLRERRAAAGVQPPG